MPRGLWYNFYTKDSLFALGKYYTFIPLMIRGGSILPAQKPADTTTASRKNNFELLITLDNVKKAKGELYWDDGDSLGMYYNNMIINCNNSNNFLSFICKNS